MKPSIKLYTTTILLVFLSFIISNASAESALPAYIPTELDLPSKIIALTFDDGPSVYTDAILDILEEYGIRATFCVLGKRVIMYPEKVQRAYAMGCDIVGHSWDHQLLVKLSDAEVIEQIIKTHQAITQAVGADVPMIYRAPGGTTSARVRRISAEQGFMLLHWTVGSNDFALRDPKKIHRAIYYNIHDGALILCHDIYGETVRAMRTIIPKLLSQGYQFVTITEYITIFGDAVQPGYVYAGHR